MSNNFIHICLVPIFQYERPAKGISALSWSFLLENWNKTNVYEIITHYMSCQQCQTVSNSVNSVNIVNSVNSVNTVNSYSAVLPPSPMVFLKYILFQDSFYFY